LEEKKKVKNFKEKKKKKNKKRETSRKLGEGGKQLKVQPLQQEREGEGSPN